MKVKVYSTSSCPWCQTVKGFLRKNNIPFEDIDVGSDEKAAKEMIEKSDQMGVPVTEIDDKMVIGFNKPVLEELLGLGKDA